MSKASVIVPVYNMPQWVGECITSVLRQTLVDWELIVVDDGSTDNTADVVRSFKDSRITLISLRQNKGCTHAINSGVRESTGKYICPLAADDMLEPWMLEKQSAYLDAHPNVAAVFGMPLVMSEQGEVLPYDGPFAKPANRSRTEWFNALLEGNTLMGQTMLYRNSLHNELGYWDESLKSGNDIDWFIRIVKAHDIYVQHIPMARVRMRDDKSALSSDTQIKREGHLDEMNYIRKKHAPSGDVPFAFEGKLIIATPFRDQSAKTNYVKSMVITARFLDGLKVNWDWWDYHIEEDVNRVKNAICTRFLHDKDATDLLLVNPDLYWNPAAIAKLLLHKDEVIAGCFPVGQNWSVELPAKAEGKLSNGSVLLSANFAQSGFMRIKKSALLQLRERYPGHYFDRNSGMAEDCEITPFFEPLMGELGDEAFCRRWKTIGQIWVEPQITFEVAGTAMYVGNLDQHLRTINQQKQAA